MILLLVAGPQTGQVSAIDKITDNSVICQATSSEGGAQDVSFVLGPWAISADHEESCRHFNYQLEGPIEDDEGSVHLITETFSFFGYCGENSANRQICENYGLRITQADLNSATEENNEHSECLGVLEDEGNLRHYYLLRDTPCEPYYSYAIFTQ